MATHQKRKWARLLVIGAILLAVPVVIVITLKWQGEARVDGIVARAEARGLPTSISQWRERQGATSSAREHAAVLVAALRLLHQDTSVEPQIPYVSQAPEPEPGETISPALAAALDAYMAERAAALAAITAATAHEAFNFADQYDEHGLAMDLLSNWRRGARAFQVACLHAQVQGDTALATQAILNLAALNRAFDDEPLLVSELARVACDALMVRTACDMFSRLELTDAQLATLRDAFDRRVAMPDASTVFASELAYSLDRLATMPAAAKRALSQDTAVLLEIQGLFEARKADSAELYQDLQALVDPAKPTAAPVAAATSILKARAILALGQNMLAIERHRLQHGDWPRRIEDVPHAVRDPLTGDWPAYSLTDTGCVISSKEFPADEMFTFQLYSPEHR